MRGQPPNFGFSGAGWGQPQPQQQQQPPPLQQQLLRQPQPQPQFPAAQYMSPNVELQMLNHGRQTSVGFVPGHHNVNFPMQNSNLPIQNYGFQFPQPRNPGFYFQQPPIPNPSLNFSQLPNPGFNNPQPPPYMGSLPHYSTKNPAEGTTRADNSVAKACWTKKPVEGTTRTDNAVAKASSTKKPTEGTTGMDNAVAKASSTKKPTEGTTGMDNAVAKVSLAKNPAEGTTRTDNAVAKASSAKNPEEGTTGTENAVAKASSTKREDIMRINNAVAKAHNDLLVTKENITAWKVLQSALSILQVDSWDSFGFRLQQIDALHRLMLIEGKINSFIHCFVGVRRIATLYELEMAICKNEGVKQFEELRLGPFLCHPLVLHYFSLSSEVTEVFNIKNEEIVSFLSEFMDADVCKNKNITVEDFLDFISRKRSVTNREMLGIRVQNLGMHVSIIRKARKSEDDILSKFLKKSDEKRRKRPLFKLHKQQLDERFSAISQRVESFSSSQKDFCGKHVRFGSSSEDEDSDDNTCENKKNAHDSSSVLKLSLQSNKSSDHDSGCPYPSATEEMTRLGLKGEVTGHTTPVGGQKHTIGSGTSKRKRKSRDENHTTFGSSTLGKKVKVEANILDKDSFDNSHEGSDDEAEYKITNNSLRIFITTWKDGCRDMNVDEVLKRMLDHYSIKYQSTIRVRSMLSSYPFIGLLNVAVSSIRNGMWDSIYDSLQTINLHELTNTHVAKQPVYECIDVGPSAEGALIQHVPKSTYGITVEDILNKVGQHVKFEQEIHSSSRIVMENRIRILKQLCSCEFWLVEQFSAKDFKSLGHGDFFTFLQKHASMLPHELCKFLMPEISERPPLEACMLQHQLVNLVSQACNNLSENEILSKQLICALLTQQFPLISFKLTENGSFENFMELVGQQKNNVVSKCVTFSVTLLGRCQSRDSLASPKNDLSGVTLVTDELGQRMRAFGSATSEDATKVLIRAPMLLDLNLWSHWDTLFAPTLGPLVPWLQNEVNIEFFLCLVTKEGKVIRIDHTATADSFLDAALQGSPFRTAVKLLSIFALLGGEKHVPISLLKHHANRAFEVIIKNSVDNVDMFDNWAKGHGKAHQNFLEQVAADNMNCELKNKIVTRNKAIPILSRFFVDCLGYLPAEFRFLAADILLSGISSSIKDATSGILHECHKPEHRLMLHEIGLSLGVVEWIQDHHTFSSSASSDLFTDESACLNDRSDINRNLHIGGLLTKHSAIEQNASFPNEENMCKELATSTNFTTKTCNDSKSLSCVSLASEPGGNKDAAEFVQSIRHDEFGLDPGLSNSETGMLRKQHARLGRALHCLSQELYSQDSHFLLELVQNADDNIYPRSVEPTLAFIFEDSGIVVLNNEEGFSAQNIKALCDVGNSTKKGSNAGYIGKKGIGFKSVFRVTDAPEIHSNGFHIKFDISEGQIGFVLPTIISPCNINLYGNLASNTSDQQDTNIWNTCIVLPFRSKLSGGNLINNIVNMFADLHPSLLLFLHRLQCIKIRNLLDNSLIVMRKEIVGNGIIKVSHGEDKMTWLVVSQRLKADVIRHDVQSTEISIAFTLQEEENGVYSPFLDQQQVFAFLPLRMYGLKFIIQGDFVLPSSREEVDGDNPWNQWLLSEFPDLFVSAVKSFCYLPCFKSCSGKAIAAYMSYVPLIGEVHGFFSSLPRLIISKLRMSNCLLLEGKESESVPPCKVLRGWNEQALTLLPDTLLHEHLGLGFLDKDVILSDSLARALGIEEYGPKILVQFISSLCQKHNSLKSMGLVWLGSCLDALHNMLVQSSVQTALELERNVDLIRSLQKVPLIPLSDGTYSSVAEGTIWLHSDSSNTTVDGKYGLEAFPNLNAKIRVICPAFLSLFSIDNSHMDAPSLGNISRMLHRIGVQRLSAHEIIKVHVIPAISNESNLNGNKILMTEYVCFVMTHLLSSCPECQVEKGFIVSELRNKALILTNHGYKRPVEVPVHFSKDYGNPIDVDKIINVKVNWHEVDDTYMKHPVTHSLPSGLTKWRNFFQEIGITDFVHVVEVNRSIADMPRTIMTNRMWDPDLISSSSVVKDWESPELSHLLTLLSVHGNQESCKYLLEVLDTLWDDHLSDKVVGCCISKSDDSSKQFQSAFMNSICDVQWVVSSVDDKLHYPKDLYYDCDAVHSILGTSAPYAVPKVRSTKLVRDIGFKTSVTLDDALDILKVWRTEKPFKTSISQMCTFYTFLWNEMSASKQKIMEEFHSGPFIFIPIVADSRHEDVVSGVFLSPNEVYWSDPIGSIDKIKDVYLQCSRSNMVDSPIIKTLCNIYPGLKKFFIGECGIHEYPPLCSYLQILKQISEVAFPSQASDIVFQVYLKWADGLKSGLLSSENVAYLKECIGSSEFMVLPTELDKWVSLHPSTRIVCCCDDERLRQQCKNMGKIDFVYFGEINNDRTEAFQEKITHLLKALGVPLLSEIVTREAKYYGLRDSSFKTSLMNWALPFAQRYMYSVHLERYAKLKQSGFDILSRLRVIVVEKLFFSNVIKNFGLASDEQVPCSCLLQDNILYTTQDSDSHSLFMEFSRLLFNGTPELHLANFLHMITTMAESGATKEQTEFFILNTQKVTKLPEEEPVWSLSSVTSLVKTPNLLQTSQSPTLPNVQGSSSMAKKNSENWPPADWKTAPGFRYAQENGFKTQPASSPPDCNLIDNQSGNLAPIPTVTDWTYGGDSSSMSVASVVYGTGDYVGQHINHSDVDPEAIGSQSDSPGISWRTQLRTGTPNPAQAMAIGRLGEQVAFKYFAEKFSNTLVKWVNEDMETGFPFDIIIGEDEDSRQYIEVKSTRSARKDWFDISLREWQFAVEKGELFSIAHVLLLANNVARVTVFQNPVKSCQSSKLQLALLMPKQQIELSPP